MALLKQIIIDGAQLEYWSLSDYSVNAGPNKNFRLAFDGFISKDYKDKGGVAGKQLQITIANYTKVEQKTEVRKNEETGEDENHEIVSPVAYNDADDFDARRRAIGVEQAAYEYVKTLPDFKDATDI